jgi:hypothetical protein
MYFVDGNLEPLSVKHKWASYIDDIDDDNVCRNITPIAMPQPSTPAS